MKKCPFCQEEIQDTAVKCRYCGEWLDKKEEPTLNKELSNSKLSTHSESSPQQNIVNTDHSEIPTEKVISYAGFWKRVLAWLIDLIITTIGIIAVVIWFGIMFGGGTLDTATWERMGSSLGLIITWLYFVLMESSPKQATLGKMALSIKVTDLNGSKISLARANGRFFSKFISAIMVGIGYIMVAFTQKKQGLHDIMAGCLVINSVNETVTSNEAVIEKKFGEANARPAEKVRNGHSKWFIPVLFICIVFIVIAIVATFFYYKDKEGLNEVAVTEAPEPPKVLTAEDWDKKAHALWIDGKYADPQKAIEYLTKAIELQSDYTIAHFDRGLAYNDLGQYQQAIEDYNEAIRQRPNYAGHFFFRGNAYFKLGQYQQAIDDYNETIRLAKDDTTAYLSRGVAYVNLGQYQRAIEDYNEVIRLQPNNAKAYDRRGSVYLVQGKNKLACIDAQKACALGNCELLELAKGKGLCR